MNTETNVTNTETLRTPTPQELEGIEKLMAEMANAKVEDLEDVSDEETFNVGDYVQIEDDIS